MNKTDLISRSALLEKNQPVDFLFGHDEDAPYSGMAVAACDVEDAPAVDAVPVVHGRWEEWWPGISVIMTGEEMLCRCSHCDAKYADIEGYRYCPNCGAKMDGGNGNV